MDHDVGSETPVSTGVLTAEEELRRSRAFLDSIIENIPNMVFVKDAAELRFVLFNRAGEDLVGYSCDEMVGKNDHDFFPAAEAEFFIGKDREVLESGRVLDIPAESIQTRHRGPRILHTQKIPILDDDGRPEYLLGISEDITERVRTDEALRERQQTLDAMFQASPDAIMVVTPDLVVKEVSPALAHILGAADGEHTTRVVMEAVHPDDRDAVEHSLKSVFAAGSASETVEARYRILHTDGHWVPVEGRGRALVDSEGTIYGAVFMLRDISERVRAEQELREARQEAEAANRTKNDFLSRMSHELRTPLNAVLGFAQLLEMDLTEESDLESVGHILRGGRHLLELINDVLDISRIEAGTLPISMETIDLAEVLHECVHLVGPQAAARGITIEVRGDADRLVHADRHRISQVLLNLLSNALKFNHDGGGVTIDIGATDGTMRLAVTDTGPGMTPELLDRLFTPFDRLGANERGIEGTGLGLVVSRRLCEAMGIDLCVESTAGVGSTFWIDVPAGAAASRASRVADPRPNGGSLQGRGTVLHIEDNIANLRLVEQVLRHRPGLRLMDAVQGSLGVDLAVQHRPDLILLDVHLPDLPGFVVLQRLKADHRTADIPVVIVSADATPSQIERFRGVGASDYLTKPLDVEQLLSVLDSVGVDGVSGVEQDDLDTPTGI